MGREAPQPIKDQYLLLHELRDHQFSEFLLAETYNVYTGKPLLTQLPVRFIMPVINYLLCGRWTEKQHSVVLIAKTK